jgi:hypothetical protein
MDWLRSEDLNEENNVIAPVLIIAVHRSLLFANDWRGVIFGHDKITSRTLGLRIF